MIEIIREESWDSTQEKTGLPKNIKQIGAPDIGERIYIEDSAYQYIHSYHSSAEKNAYVLLGRFEEYGGRKCTFIEAAILLEEICFDGALPVWNDETWAYLYRQLKHAYDEMVIVGWAMDIRGQLPNLTAPLEKLHRTYFGGMRQLLFLMDSLEGEENFYTQKNGRLSRREGYYIYYDKSIPVRLDTAMEMLHQEKMERQEKEEPSFYQNEQHPLEENIVFASQKEDIYTEDVRPKTGRMESRTSLYRDYLKEQTEKKLTKPAYSSTLLLAVVALALGIAAFRNYEKMSAMEEALAKMNAAQTTIGTEGQENGTVNGLTEGVGQANDSEGVLTIDANASVDAAEVNTPDGNGVKIETVSGNVSKSGDEAAETEKIREEDEGQQATETDVLSTEENAPTEHNEGENSETESSSAGDTSDSTESDATSETAETMTESQTYLSQGYYIVQKGESLAGICKKIYQTTALLDKLCEVNSIEDPDAIYEGQKLILPN